MNTNSQPQNTVPLEANDTVRSSESRSNPPNPQSTETLSRDLSDDHNNALRLSKNSDEIYNQVDKSMMLWFRATMLAFWGTYANRQIFSDFFSNVVDGILVFSLCLYFLTGFTSGLLRRLSGETLAQIAIVLTVAFVIPGLNLIVVIIKSLMNPASFFKNDSPGYYTSLMVVFLVGIGYSTCSESKKNWDRFFKVSRLQEERRRIQERKNE